MRETKPATAPAQARDQPLQDKMSMLEREPISVDVCVIGAGPGGLAAAQAAVMLGRSVILVEKNAMGGSSLNTGSVPMNALRTAASRAEAMRTSGKFGIKPVEPEIDRKAVQRHVKASVAALAQNCSIERLAGLGIRVILGTARFEDRQTITVGDYRIAARRFIIATGSTPAIPAIPGLDQTAFFTSQTISGIDRKLDRLVVIGATSEGIELAQAFARLGSKVTVLEPETALKAFDPELSAVVLRRLDAEGIDVREGAQVTRIEPIGTLARLHAVIEGRPVVFESTYVLAAAGRQPSVSDLNLAAAGIKFTARGVTVDRGLKTSNSRAYAIGSVTGALASPHAAAHHASIAIRRALLWQPAKANDALIPRLILADPELAQVGLTDAEAAARKISVNVYRWPYAENERAVVEHETAGHIKVVTDKKGHILGVGIVGAKASELIHVGALAVSQRLNIAALASQVSPRPTLGEIAGNAALRYLYASQPNPLTRKIINFLAKLG